MRTIILAFAIAFMGLVMIGGIPDAIDGDVLNVMTTGLLSDLCQRPPPQIVH